MAALLQRVDNPHRGLRCIHIAGSKGKGSTALMIEALLERNGTRTGTYTSPHLERWTERFRIGGGEVTREHLDEALDLFRPHVDALTLANPGNPPSFFDVLTAAALWLFKRHRVAIAIIEAGIGGRYDATNVIEPAVACITSVELEHADKLGADLESIAYHKAGILKAGALAVLGPLPKAAAGVIQRELQLSGSSSLWCGQDFHFHNERRGGGRHVTFDSGGERIEFILNHPGRRMAENAALALACVSALPDFRRARLAHAATALASVELPGRAEVLQTAPWIVVDAAHTPASITALAELLEDLPGSERHFSERHFLVSVSGDKPVALLAPLLDTATSVTVTCPEPLRSLPAARLAEMISNARPGLEIHLEPDVPAALSRARSKLKPDSLLCATGSTYLAGAVRKLIRRDGGGDDGDG